jgi:hypothetical protein
MIQDKRHKLFDETVGEWLRDLPAYLDDIGIDLGAIVQNGRSGFGLEGRDLAEFVRKSLHGLVKHGAKPRHWGSLSYPGRNIPLHYGNDTPEEIVEGVIADWLAPGAGEPEWGDFWFDLPEMRED